MKMDLYKKVTETGICSIKKVSQTKQPEKWAELRTTGIGGSDAGAIMGMNEYSSPLVVYMQKKGEGVFEGNVSTKWGHLLEDPIRNETEKELGVHIEEVPGMFKSKIYPFMNANLDGLILTENPVTIGNNTVDGLGGHEIKTSAKGDGFGTDEIPDSYYCQVQHYMAVTGLPWFILTVFILSKKEGRHYIVKANPDFQKDLINVEEDFWENFVMTNTIPAPTGTESESEILKSLPMAESIELPEELSFSLGRRAEIKEQIKMLEEEEKQISNNVLLEMYKASNVAEGEEPKEKIVATCGSYKVSLSLQKRNSVDTDALKSAGLYEKFAKVSMSKVMRVSGGK
ncbi:MAG: YqaJ viral recombinase family protein [Bacilli bacterium]|nr:YqaJ viral recombinase family protein [Bacilli bacterium]